MGLPITIHDKIELREKTKERIDEIKKMKRTREIKLENLFIRNNKNIDLLLKLDIDKKRLTRRTNFIRD